MTRACMIHPENECHPDAEDRCVCAPPGVKHDASCATTRGEKCNCMVLVVNTPDALSMALALRALGSVPRGRTDE